MISTGQQIINQVVVGLLAIIVLGGTLALLLVGRDVPTYWQTFDGMVIVAAFANGAFFIQARTGLPVANALSQALDHLSVLAEHGSATTVRTSTGHTVMTGTDSTS